MSEEITKEELVLNILQQVEIGESNNGNKCIKDIDDVVDSIVRVYEGELIDNLIAISKDLFEQKQYYKAGQINMAIDVLKEM